MTLKEKVEWYAILHKQNLNGRETEDELFEAGILVGIEETLEEIDNYAIEFAKWIVQNCNHSKLKFLDYKELLEIFKKEKGL